MQAMKKKWKFVLINLLIVIVMIGVGGKVYLDKREARKEAEKIEAERMSVIALKNTFEDIQSVRFERTEYNIMTGYYSMFVKMTNINGAGVRFSYSFATNHPDEISAWTVKDEENVQKEGVTEGKVKVIYSNGAEEEI